MQKEFYLLRFHESEYRYENGNVFFMRTLHYIFYLGLIALIGCDPKVKKDGEIIEGVEYYYHPNGEVKAKFEVDATGVRNGFSKFYFEDGKLQQESSFIDGKLEGESRTYFQSGKIKNISHFSNGVGNGEAVENYDNGNVLAKGIYWEGEKSGIFVDFYESGKSKWNPPITMVCEMDILNMIRVDKLSAGLFW